MLQLSPETVFGSEPQLEAQAVVPKKLDPVIAPRVRLRRRANRVIPMPAELLLGVAVLFRKLFAQQSRCVFPRKIEIDPFKRKHAFAVRSDAAEYLRHADRFGEGELL